MARRFVDARGMEWEVWEVKARPVLADAPPRRRNDGWLRFDSATQSRRLSRYPDRWEALSVPALAELCEAASPEPPVAISFPDFIDIDAL